MTKPRMPQANRITTCCVRSLTFCLLLAGQTVFGQSPFQKLVDRNSPIPGTADGFFNSFNPPAIDQQGNVVFRGRGSGPQNSAGVQGNYLTHLKKSGFELLADRNTIVPGSLAATFNSFPAVPRIDYGSIVFRGMSEPLLPGQEGNAGVYHIKPGELATAVNRTFTVPPDHLANFGQFPGAPDVMTLKGRGVGKLRSIVVTKGNWSQAEESENNEEQHGGGGPGGGHEGESTGVYIRDLTTGGPVLRIADTTTTIPGSTTLFGSTASPSAADGKIVFVGYDDESAPTEGGLYLADAIGLMPDPELVPLVELGQSLPGGGQVIRISENLSFDGTTVAFHALTGVSSEAICTVDVNEPGVVNVIAGTPTEIPGAGGVFQTFLFANMQGRFSSFAAVDGEHVVFQGAGSGGLVGLYATIEGRLRKVIDTADDGGLLDPEMIGTPITELGIERDAISQGKLVFIATIGDEEESSESVKSVEAEDDFQRGIYTTTLTKAGGGTYARQTGDLLQIIGDPLANGVAVHGINLFGLQVVIVSSSLGSSSPVVGSGLYSGVDRLQIDLRDGDDTLRVKGTFLLQEFSATGGPGNDAWQNFLAQVDAVVEVFTEFEIERTIPAMR